MIEVRPYDRVSDLPEGWDALAADYFQTRDFLPRVRANGVEASVSLAQRNIDLSEFRVTLPHEAALWKRLQVTIESGMPLRFGYAEVR